MQAIQPREAVAEAARAIIAADGIEALYNSRLFAARLGDRVPTAKRETRVLGQALADGVVSRIHEAGTGRKLILPQLASQIEDAHGYQRELTLWAVMLVDSLLSGETMPVTSPALAPAHTPAPDVATKPVPPSANAFNTTPALLPVEEKRVPPQAVERPASAASSVLSDWKNTPRATIIAAIALTIFVTPVIGAVSADALQPFVTGWKAYPEDAVDSLITGAAFALPVMAFAVAGFRGSAVIGCMVVIVASVLVKLAGGSVILDTMAGFFVAALLQGGASVVTEAFLLMRGSSRTGFLSMAIAGAIYATAGGFFLAVPWLLFEMGSGSSSPALNAYALVGLLIGGSIAGGFAAILFAPLLRRLSAAAVVGRAGRS